MVRAWLGEGLRVRVIGCRRPAAPADARPAFPVRPGEFKVREGTDCYTPSEHCSAAWSSLVCTSLEQTSVQATVWTKVCRLMQTSAAWSRAVFSSVDMAGAGRRNGAETERVEAERANAGDVTLQGEGRRGGVDMRRKRN